jgi:hypothetical protein
MSEAVIRRHIGRRDSKVDGGRREGPRASPEEALGYVSDTRAEPVCAGVPETPEVPRQPPRLPTETSPEANTTRRLKEVGRRGFEPRTY